MKVKAKVKLYYGIIRDAGTVFDLTDPKHFDKRVHEVVEEPKAAKAAKADKTDDQKKPDDGPTAEQIKAEQERLAADNAAAAAAAAKPAAPAAATPTPRRRSTAEQR